MFAKCFIPTPVCYLYTYYQRITIFTGLDGSYVADVGNPNNAFVLIFANCSLNYFYFSATFHSYVASSGT